MKEFFALQREMILKAFKHLSEKTDAAASVKPGNGWSKKEIMGHLIDSAANNHQRFVRAQLAPDLNIVGYAQDDWVRVQNYQGASWNSILEFWKSYNLMLLHILEQIPDEQLSRERRHNNIAEYGFTEALEGETTTLGYIVTDYFAHMQHHLEAALKA